MNNLYKRVIEVFCAVALCALPLSACSPETNASNTSSSKASQSAAPEESYDIVIGEEGYDTFSFVITNATDLTFGSSAETGLSAESIVARPAGSLEYSEVLPLAVPWESGQAAKMYFVDTALSAATVDSVESDSVETEASESEATDEAAAAATTEDTTNMAADLLIEGACDLKLIASNGSEYVLHQLVPSKLQDAQDIQLKIDSATSLAYIEYELNGQTESTLQSEIEIKNAEDEALAAQAAEEAAVAEAAAQAAEAAAAEQAAAEYQNYNSVDVAQQDDACVSADDIPLR